MFNRYKVLLGMFFLLLLVLLIQMPCLSLIFIIVWFINSHAQLFLHVFPPLSSVRDLYRVFVLLSKEIMYTVKETLTNKTGV